MKLPEELHSKQVSTTLTEQQYNDWTEFCKQEGKSSFLLLRELVVFTIKKPE